MPESPPTPYRVIGRGNCGSVWALEEGNAYPTPCVLKREDGDLKRSVQNDFDMHRKVFHAISTAEIRGAPLIPRPYSLIQSSDRSWWVSRLGRFPQGHAPCRSLLSEQIPHFSKSAREALIDFCCPEHLVAAFVKSNPGDEHCLIRPYLGRRRRTRDTSCFNRFSLRNLPLHIDQMKSLDLDILSYIHTMAKALAIMHWAARVDANDVEFVLAPCREGGDSSRPVFQSAHLGDYTMWILDFDCCHSMTMDEAGVEKACMAFFNNDPFYPRPGGLDLEDQWFWEVFREQFLKASKQILGGESEFQHLPGMLAKKIEEAGEALRMKKEQIHRAQSEADGQTHGS